MNRDFWGKDRLAATADKGRGADGIGVLLRRKARCGCVMVQLTLTDTHHQILLVCGAAAMCVTIYVVYHLEKCPHTGRLRFIFQSVTTDRRQGEHAFAEIKRSSAAFPPSRSVRVPVPLVTASSLLKS